jgi:23S rRNA (uracil1939-C5)-methyltransferase
VKLHTLRAEHPVYGGYVIGRDGKVVFIKGAIPGEVVEVSEDERRKDYSLSSVTQVLEPSSHRRDPHCSLFGLCGGCHLQFVSYERQVSMKEEVLLDALRRIGNLEMHPIAPMTDTEFRYRRKGRFKVSRRGEIGFYREGTREVVPVEECPLMVDGVNSTLRYLRASDICGLKEVQIISGDSLSLLVKGSITEDRAQEILDLGISGIAFENGTSIGKDYISLDLNGLTYTVTNWSFFQANWALNQRVVRTVVEDLLPLEGKRILDLYAGAGNFSLSLSRHAEEVTAVEENPYAVEDGRRNAMLNGIKNCSFTHASVEELYEGKRKHKGARLLGEAHYHVIIVDPPRHGLTDVSLGRILESRPERIVYVSCNPATLARDLKRMREIYDITSIRMVDFFPNTYHIETIAFLSLR